MKKFSKLVLLSSLLLTVFSCSKEEIEPNDGVANKKSDSRLELIDIDFSLSSNTAIVGEKVDIIQLTEGYSPVYQCLLGVDYRPWYVFFGGAEEKYLNVEGMSFTFNDAFVTEVNVIPSDGEYRYNGVAQEIKFKQFVINKVHVNRVPNSREESPSADALAENRIVVFLEEKGDKDSAFVHVTQPYILSESPLYYIGEQEVSFSQETKGYEPNAVNFFDLDYPDTWRTHNHLETRLVIAYESKQSDGFFEQISYHRIATSDAFNPYQNMDSDSTIHFESSNFTVECSGYWLNP